MVGRSIFTGGIILLIIGVSFLAVISGAIFWLAPNPPKPEIKDGEFSFKLIYELNGDTKVVEDTFVCKFDGFENLGGGGKYRKWSLQLRDGKNYITLLDLSNLNIHDDFNHQVLELYFSPGNAEYYMGDELERKRRKGKIYDWVAYSYRTEDGKIGHSEYKSNEAFEKYKIRLISWEASQPIQNSFK